ncbi:MAG: alpha/beta hydrolase [Bacteroidetes bacterium]|nr:alpha/beta hydrolase [Bacteroidota bacterium]
MAGKKAIRFQGKQMHYTVEGEGHPVVLIHGFAEDSAVWRGQREILAAHYRVIIPDLPGAGASALTDTFSMELGADYIHQILLQEQIQKAVLIGHSMGGYITLAFAERHPDLLTGMGLFHSTAYPDSEEKKTNRQRGIDFISAHGSYEFLKQSIPNLFSPESRISLSGAIGDMIEQYRNFNPNTLIACHQAMMLRPDRSHVLSSFAGPVLFIIGKYDTAVPYEQQLKQSHLPQISYIHILEHSGHMGMWEETKKANTVLLSVLEDTVV